MARQQGSERASDADPSVAAVAGILLGTLAALVGIAAAPFWLWVKLALAVFAVASAVCITMLLDAASTRRLARWLGRAKFDDIYVGLVGWPFLRLWRALAMPVSGNADFYATFRAALTVRLYDRALLIAVIYPMILLFLPWFVSGAAVTLGGAEIVP